MPIEFQCSACSKVLRVPDGTAGKYSRCPGCSERVLIPSEDEPSQQPGLIVRIDVPCPKCKSTLECDASLDGTRGCCPSCAHVFTIRIDQESDAEGLPSESDDKAVFPFACPRCKQLFEGTPEKEGKKGKCTNCAEIFIIERYVPPKPILAIKQPLTKKPLSNSQAALPPSRKEGSGVGPKQPKPTRPRAIENPPASTEPTDAFGDLASMLPPSNPSYSSPIPSYIPSPSYAPSSASTYAPAVRKRKSSGGNSGLKIALTIVGAIGGLAILICCGGGGALYFYASGNKTISAGGYSADAPGMQFKPTMRDASVSGKAIANPRTKSEFMIAVMSTPGGQAVTTDMYISILKTNGMISESDVESTNRAGLAGFRIRMRGSGGTPPSIVEVYNLGSQVLMLAYVNGVDGAKLKGIRNSLTHSQAESIDDPESFFESLRASE